MKGKRMHVPAAVRSLPEFERIGRLSVTSKMPGFSWGTPAERCITGSRLRAVPGSVCGDCYANKGTYRFRSVRLANERRWRALTERPLEEWRDDMVAVLSELSRAGERYFRWHDTGDVQSVDHFAAICDIARAVPGLKFWLPTREIAMVHAAVELRGITVPDNLTVRLSVPRVDGALSGVAARLVTRVAGIAASGVTATGEAVNGGKICRAYERGGECGLCRACWRADVETVTYPLH